MARTGSAKTKIQDCESGNLEIARHSVRVEAGILKSSLLELCVLGCCVLAPVWPSLCEKPLLAQSRRPPPFTPLCAGLSWLGGIGHGSAGWVSSSRVWEAFMAHRGARCGSGSGCPSGVPWRANEWAPAFACQLHFAVRRTYEAGPGQFERLCAFHCQNFVDCILQFLCIYIAPPGSNIVFADLKMMFHSKPITSRVRYPYQKKEIMWILSFQFCLDATSMKWCLVLAHLWYPLLKRCLQSPVFRRSRTLSTVFHGLQEFREKYSFDNRHIYLCKRLWLSPARSAQN